MQANRALTALTRQLGRLEVSSSKSLFSRPLLQSSIAPFSTITSLSTLSLSQRNNAESRNAVFKSFSTLAFKPTLNYRVNTTNPVDTNIMITRAMGSKKSTKLTGKKKAELTRKKRLAKSQENPLKREASLQHKEWVEFQKGISVDGFQTGQTLVARTTLKKQRGGAQARKLKARERELEEKLNDNRRFTDVGAGKFPPMRYDDETTERLLAEAYAAIPKRDGKRGSRNRRRQRQRWHLVRVIRRTYKTHMRKFQLRKMIKRSEKIQGVKAILKEAPTTRTSDREYQLQILQKYMMNMKQKENSSSNYTVPELTDGSQDKVTM